LNWNVSGPLHLCLVRIELTLDKSANGADDQFLLVGEAKVHLVIPPQLPLGPIVAPLRRIGGSDAAARGRIIRAELVGPKPRRAAAQEAPPRERQTWEATGPTSSSSEPEPLVAGRLTSRDRSARSASSSSIADAPETAPAAVRRGLCARREERPPQSRWVAGASTSTGGSTRHWAPTPAFESWATSSWPGPGMRSRPEDGGSPCSRRTGFRRSGWIPTKPSRSIHVWHPKASAGRATYPRTAASTRPATCAHIRWRCRRRAWSCASTRCSWA